MENGFNLKLSGLTTASIVDYRMLTAKTAQVVVKTSIRSASQLAAKLYSVMKGSATPISASFRWLDKPTCTVAMGFVSLLDETRTVDDSSITASYSLMASGSNQYLDPSDQTLWTLRTSNGKKVMVRNSDDDLGELLHHVKAHSVPDVPKLNYIQASTVEAHMLAAYVREPEAGIPSVDYGIVVGRKQDSGNPILLNAFTGAASTVNKDLVIGYYGLDTQVLKAAKEQADAQEASSGTKAIKAGFDAKPVIDYYRKVIPYSSEYMKELVKVINETAAL